ncbi:MULTISPECIES: bifunctional aminoglycoside phosphotransferase/ATP-binding protein [unclassified Streptomyces]|uniref:bifunctional aminoglycoside phosphotransferase/ATP-binding protein n=1 Tax=unclassified Streptomyces TaxID=2593676 RepID=UPI002E237312|nr:AAA family ATPase [Streptomyces sp. NBC_01023]
MSSNSVEDSSGTEKPRPAEITETHTAVVMFVGDHAYKLKKPVDLGFLDFRTARARHAACEREVLLNRRFAPDVYEGVAEVGLPWGGPPEPVVVMRRMPAGRRLSHLVTAGAPVDDALRRTARLLAACHAGSPRTASISQEGTRDALLARWEDSFEQIHALKARLPLPHIGETAHLVRRYLAGRQDVFDTRIREGRVVDGHGDLLAEDIFCLDDGPRVLDCLEFDETLRHVDGLDDAAFLAMDLERLGAPEAAAYFLARYSEYSGDHAPASLRHHYVAYRAFVRAKVSLFREQQGVPAARSDAERFADITVRHLRASAVRLVLIGGPPAGGKSTLAGGLADRLGLTLLNSDRVRKEVAGLPPERPAPAEYERGIYTPAWTRRTYEELLGRASALLAAGESVVVDASWNLDVWRRAATEAARRHDADLVALRCEVPRDVAAMRLAARPPGPSDAGPVVGDAMAAAAEPWPEAVTVDTSGSPAAAVERAVAAVRPDGAGARGISRRPFIGTGLRTED